jgi:hypothetical protein
VEKSMMTSSRLIIDELRYDEDALSFFDVNIALELPAELCDTLDKVTNETIFDLRKRVKRKSRAKGVSHYVFHEHNLHTSFKFSYSKMLHIPLHVLTDILEVLNQNQEMINQLPEDQIAAIDKYRLCIMQSVYKEIDKKGRKPARTRSYGEDEGARIFQWFKKHWAGVLAIVFGAFFVTGLTLDVLFNYAGFYAAVGLISFISPPVLIGICLSLTIMNLMLYVAFEGAMLGELFDVRPSPDEKKKIDAWDEQIETTREINERLNDRFVRHEMDREGSTSAFLRFDMQCDRLIFNRQHELRDEHCNETPARKKMRIGLIVLGAFLSMGSSCFGAMSMLPVLPVILPFTGLFFLTPVGIGVFVGVVVLYTLLSYLAMQRKAIAQLASPNLDKRIEIGKKLDEYHDRQFSPKFDKKNVNEVNFVEKSAICGASLSVQPLNEVEEHMDKAERVDSLSGQEGISPRL